MIYLKFIEILAAPPAFAEVILDFEVCQIVVAYAALRGRRLMPHKIRRKRGSWEKRSGGWSGAATPGSAKTQNDVGFAS